MNHKRRWLLLSSACLVGALVFVTLVPNVSALFQNKPLYGHQTQFSLPKIPVNTHKNETLDWQEIDKTPYYFTTGFTHCEHACPITMAQYRLMEKSLGNEARFIFLTVDPKRDDPDRLSEYLGYFSKDFIGLRTNDTPTLKALLESLRQSYNLGQGNSDINHQNTIYLAHPNAEGLIVYTRNRMDVKKMQQDLKILSES